jgi:hypothetical protein
MQISRLLIQLSLNVIWRTGTDGNSTADESKGRPDGKVFRPFWSGPNIRSAIKVMREKMIPVSGRCYVRMPMRRSDTIRATEVLR